MKVIIIDSNKNDTKVFCDYVNSNFLDVTILAQASTVEAGKEAIQLFSPEVVFMDVEFADGTAFDLLNAFKYVFFKIIFISKNKDSLVKAIRYRIFDYISKPFELNEINIVFNRLRAIDYRDDAPHHKEISFTNKKFIGDNCNKKIVLATDNSIYVVDVDSITHCKADLGYTVFHLNNSPEIMVTRTLKEYETLLGPYSFIRTHKSFLVNFKFINRFSYDDGGMIYLKNNATVPVSFRKRDTIIKTITSLAIN